MENYTELLVRKMDRKIELLTGGAFRHYEELKEYSMIIDYVVTSLGYREITFSEDMCDLDARNYAKNEIRALYTILKDAIS